MVLVESDLASEVVTSYDLFSPPLLQAAKKQNGASNNIFFVYMVFLFFGDTVDAESLIR